MNREELVEKLMTKTKQPVTHADMTRIVAGFMDEVKAAVAEGDSVSLVGFGTFTCKDRAARTARNPQTGEAINIPAKKTPVFKASKAFKDAVNK